MYVVNYYSSMTLTDDLILLVNFTAFEVGG